MSKELGEKLLQGWTMLADCCPKSGCYTPLVEKKKDNTILCVSCKTYFRRQDKEMIPIDSDSNAKQATDTATSKSNITNITTSTNFSAAQFSDADDDDYEFVPPPKDDKQKDQLVSTMGSMLLSGWTMLAYNCPQCTVPLMKNTKSEMWCLSCTTQVVSQSDFDPTKHKIVSSPTAVPTPAPKVSTPVLSTPPTQPTQVAPPIPARPFPKPEIHDSQPLTPKPQLSVSPVFNANVPVPIHTPTNTISPPHRLPSAPVQVIGSAKSALYQKIEECTQMLRITHDISTCIELAKTMAQCADALTALSNIPDVSSSLRS